ncbi:Class II abasic (AP) endonuclease [Clarireedia jacksonii]
MMEGDGKTSNQGLRITTWNVNGIRNPFGYQPWRDKRTFSAMFDILETDIIVMQEAKIQRKDLRDDMVLVPGWDVYFSLPKHKKGYSGVAIYTRNAVCVPIRAEEGITGVLTPPNSTTSFRDLPKNEQIGGYPTGAQLSDYFLDAATLDSEGRCVVLEFPAFVLIGVYCPANRDESRDEFRLGFLNALDTRVRNLVAEGKRVFLAGDLNIIRDEIDTANAEEQLKKQGMTVEQYVSTPARRLFNHLVVGGRVVGERDEGRETEIMWDLCRGFHPERKGMFTCWDTKLNTRPGNFGSRIDYVLCSKEWKDWFQDANIQEGLMGSDHCPVYATLKPKVNINGAMVDIRDIMSKDMFKDGVRLRDWTTKDLLPTSAKLIPEFDRRQSIRDMFTRKSSTQAAASSISTPGSNSGDSAGPSLASKDISQDDPKVRSPEASPVRKPSSPAVSVSSSSVKRPSFASSQSPSRPSKRGKTDTSFNKTSAGGKGAKGQLVKGQSNLMGFFKPKQPTTIDAEADRPSTEEVEATSDEISHLVMERSTDLELDKRNNGIAGNTTTSSNDEASSMNAKFILDERKDVIDPIVAKESWSKLLKKRVAPKCEHNDPCISHVTKKQGINCGRSFYMCARPLGPSGQQEKNTEWRCGTFIWSSEWNGKET